MGFRRRTTRSLTQASPSQLRALLGVRERDAARLSEQLEAYRERVELLEQALKDQVSPEQLAMLRATEPETIAVLAAPPLPEPTVDELLEARAQVNALVGELAEVRAEVIAAESVKAGTGDRVQSLEEKVLRTDELLERRQGQIERLSDQVARLKQILADNRQQGQQRLISVRRELRQQLTELRIERQQLRTELSKVSRYAYGSYTAGVPGWQERWNASPGRRVLLYALKDYSGSFMKWARAINENSDIAARCIAFGAHQFGYEVDLLFPMPSIVDSDVLDLIGEADVIHIKDETGFYQGTNGLPSDLFSQFGLPIIFTHYGGYARKFQDDPGYRKHVQGFDARIAMTPDLVFPWFEGSFIPHSVDTASFPYSWTDGRRIAHSPSTAARKGTAEFIAALEGLDAEFDLIQGVLHDECLTRKLVCNLFFDQAGREQASKLGVDHVIGWYGNSALEAAVHGIPTIAHLSDAAFEGAERAGKDIREECPIINTPLDVQGMREVLEQHFASTPEQRRELSLSTRRWVEDFHSFRRNGQELAAVYEALLVGS